MAIKGVSLIAQQAQFCLFYWAYQDSAKVLCILRPQLASLSVLDPWWSDNLNMYCSLRITEPGDSGWNYVGKAIELDCLGLINLMNNLDQWEDENSG